MTIIRAALVLFLVPIAVSAAFAQGINSDASSRPERTYNEIGSSIQQRQQNLQQLQQNQFEMNQMRSSQERLRNTPSPPEPVIVPSR